MLFWSLHLANAQEQCVQCVPVAIIQAAADGPLETCSVSEVRFSFLQ